MKVVVSALIGFLAGQWIGRRRHKRKEKVRTMRTTKTDIANKIRAEVPLLAGIDLEQLTETELRKLAAVHSVDLSTLGPTVVVVPAPSSPPPVPAPPVVPTGSPTPTGGTTMTTPIPQDELDSVKNEQLLAAKGYLKSVYGVKTITMNEEHSADVETGQVIRAEQTGPDEVTLTVSKGEQTLTIPTGIVGKCVAEAYKILEAAGIHNDQVQLESVNAGGHVNDVVELQPPGGTTLKLSDFQGVKLISSTGIASRVEGRFFGRGASPAPTSFTPASTPMVVVEKKEPGWFRRNIIGTADDFKRHI